MKTDEEIEKYANEYSPSYRCDAYGCNPEKDAIVVGAKWATPKLKPLVWHFSDYGGHYANMPFGIYIIQPDQYETVHCNGIYVGVGGKAKAWEHYQNRVAKLFI